ncbi:fimbrial protein [Serratia rubidaea]|uniref:Fimbrial protein n=1 Tax=Serratia rubidaea TaxID=61652 RepID=A0A448SL06_SERRU|nr:fimbrial protein [Serratia rubidaea]MBH1929656.1 fimbrial protein [Serratia rubidaea]MDC6118409.1 fimbrial protein [Serratia rubidaea]MEB7585199.1 fimbrial protein [Serratia rubidaea]VEI68367.1 putative fimbrial protein StiH [Serratia rubidaea]
MRLLALLTCMLCTLPAYAEPDNTCWGDPVNIAVVDIAAAPFSSNKKGAEAKMYYEAKPREFPGICNRSTFINTMVHYVDMGPKLIPSTLNPGYFKLSDDVDILISSDDGVDFPALPKDHLMGVVIPPLGQNVRKTGFGAAGRGYIDVILRRDVIGGAIVIPSDIELYSAYRVMNTPPYYPPRPSRPLVQGRTKSGGGVIAIPSECSINQGNTIEVNFGTIQTSLIPDKGVDSGKGYVKDVALHFSCNTSLTQDIQVKLVADTAGFSANLIRSDNNALGFILKHDNKLVKPHSSFRSRVEGGVGNETITISPVRNKNAKLNGGAFNASATLVILSL